MLGWTVCTPPLSRPLLLSFSMFRFMQLSRGRACSTHPALMWSSKSVVQGILTAIVALLLYGRMVSILGATAGAAFVALTPAATALLAIPALGEWPSRIDWLAITVISAGVYMLSGGPLPWAPKPKKPIHNA